MLLKPTGLQVPRSASRAGRAEERPDDLHRRAASVVAVMLSTGVCLLMRVLLIPRPAEGRKRVRFVAFGGDGPGRHRRRLRCSAVVPPTLLAFVCCCGGRSEASPGIPHGSMCSVVLPSACRLLGAIFHSFLFQLIPSAPALPGREPWLPPSTSWKKWRLSFSKTYSCSIKKLNIIPWLVRVALGGTMLVLVACLLTSR